MDYIAALTPPLVMALGFTALVVTIVKNQGGANKAKEDAAVDAALNAAESRSRSSEMGVPHRTANDAALRKTARNADG